MHTYRFCCERPTLNASEIRALRAVCDLPISELRSRAASGEPIVELPPVSNRATLEALCAAVEAGTLPLAIYDSPGGAGSDQKLTPQQFRNHLKELRRIEAETTLSVEAELGEIEPAEFYERLKELDRNA